MNTPIAGMTSFISFFLLFFCWRGEVPKNTEPHDCPIDGLMGKAWNLQPLPGSRCPRLCLVRRAGPEKVRRADRAFLVPRVRMAIQGT